MCLWLDICLLHSTGIRPGPYASWGVVLSVTAVAHVSTAMTQQTTQMLLYRTFDGNESSREQKFPRWAFASWNFCPPPPGVKMQKNEKSIIQWINFITLIHLFLTRCCLLQFVVVISKAMAIITPSRKYSWKAMFMPILGVKIKPMLLLHLGINTGKTIFLRLGVKVDKRLCLHLWALPAFDRQRYKS